MAKKSSIIKGKNIEKLVLRHAQKRALLKETFLDKSLSIEDRLCAWERLSKLPRNSSSVRQRNRCLITGRPRGYYRQFKMSRGPLRELASWGYLMGVEKASW